MWEGKLTCVKTLQLVLPIHDTKKLQGTHIDIGLASQPLPTYAHILTAFASVARSAADALTRFPAGIVTTVDRIAGGSGWIVSTHTRNDRMGANEGRAGSTYTTRRVLGEVADACSTRSWMSWGAGGGRQ